MAELFSFRDGITQCFFALNDCSYYVLGSEKPITVITDHKPLVGAFGKPLSENTARVLKLRLDLMVFNFHVFLKF